MVDSIKRSLLLRLIPPFAHLLILILSRTITFELVGQEMVDDFRKRGKNIILAFWHSRLLLMPYYYRRFLGGPGIFAMVSRSRDGEYISRLLRRLGHQVVRGSTASGGGKAFLELSQKVDSGYDVAIIPDGPQGPRNKAKIGAIHLAQRTNSPIIPITYSASRRKVLKSWDGFILPLPFSRGVVIIGKPLEVGKESDKRIREEKRAELEGVLNSITHEADMYFLRELESGQ